MVWRRDLTVGTAGAATPDFYTAWTHPVRDWVNAKNQVTIQLEDRQFGALPAAGADWGPRLNTIINQIEQTPPYTGATIECYPEAKKISTTVELGGKKYIGIRSASHASGGIFAGTGYGASFYMGTSGMTMFKHTNQGSVNHWGPFFEGITFSAEDFPTTGTLVLLENVNQYGFRDCVWIKGATQLAISDVGVGDAAYGLLERTTFTDYSSVGLDLRNGSMLKSYDLKAFNGVAGSWAIKLAGAALQCKFFGIKLDTLAGGLWNKGHLNSFYGFSGEGCSVHLRQDKDTTIAYSGQLNRYYDVNTSFRNTAGEVGVDVTSDVNGYNMIVGYNPWGTLGAGGSAFNDPNGKMMVMSDNWHDGNGPLLYLPSRAAHPGTPPAGAFVYAFGGELWGKDTGGNQVQQT